VVLFDVKKILFKKLDIHLDSVGVLLFAALHRCTIAKIEEGLRYRLETKPFDLQFVSAPVGCFDAIQATRKNPKPYKITRMVSQTCGFKAVAPL
jgi:hypothetical protein